MCDSDAESVCSDDEQPTMEPSSLNRAEAEVADDANLGDDAADAMGEASGDEGPEAEQDDESDESGESDESDESEESDESDDSEIDEPDEDRATAPPSRRQRNYSKEQMRTALRHILDEWGARRILCRMPTPPPLLRRMGGRLTPSRTPPPPHRKWWVTGSTTWHGPRPE